MTQRPDIEKHICAAWASGAPAQEIAAAARVPLGKIASIVLRNGLAGRDHRGAPVPYADLVAANEEYRAAPRRLRTQPEIDAALARVADHLVRAA